MILKAQMLSRSHVQSTKLNFKKKNFKKKKNILLVSSLTFNLQKQYVTIIIIIFEL